MLAALLAACSDNDSSGNNNPDRADLAITQAVNVASPTVGDEVVFTITVGNSGPDGATGVVATAPLPAGHTYITHTASTGSYVAGTGQWTIGDLARDATATLAITASVQSAGDHVATATVDANQADPNRSNNSASVTVIAGASSAARVQAVFSGTVFTVPFAASDDPTPAAATNARIRVYVAEDGGGGATLGTAVSDAGGRFQLDTEADEGQRLVIRLEADGHAPHVNSFVVDTNTGIDLGNVWLHAAESLECVNGTCRSSDGRLYIDGLDPELTVVARHFNPEAETSAFPGQFGDDLGNLLFSGAFASVEVSRGDDRVTELAAPVQLRMLLPKDTWMLVVDEFLGSGKIEVPFYHFDENRGLWHRDGEADLVDADGTPLPESALAAVKAGTHTGAIYAEGPVSHFSTWNVDWPVNTHTRVRGRVVDSEGEPVSGATVYGRRTASPAQDVTVPTDDNGEFDFITLRSEQPGEDISRNGVESEPSQVKLTVKSGDDVVEGGVHTMPTEDDEETDIEIRFENPVQVRSVRIQGTVVQGDGTPANGAKVTVWTPETTLCADECTTEATADADGKFDVTTLTTGDNPVLAQGQQQITGIADGSRILVTGSQPIEPEADDPVLVLDGKSLFYTLETTISGNVISWLPAPGESVDFGIPDGAPVCEVRVTGGFGQPDFNVLKWHIFWYGAPIRSPVTYGVLPENATPLVNPPIGALSPEDVVFAGCDIGYPDAAGTVQVPRSRSGVDLAI